MGIIHDGRIAFGRVNRFQTSIDTVQCTQHHENILGSLAQHPGSSVNGEQVANVEFANKAHAHFVPVDVEIHSLEVHFDDASLKVGITLDRIGFHRSLRVLYHDHAVLVIGVGDGKGIFRQSVKEHLLGVAIVLKRLMIIQMVTGEIGKNTTCELQSTDTFLMNGMA